MTTAKRYAELNRPGEAIYWFDDLGTGEHSHAFLSNFYEGAPIVLPLLTHQEFKTGEHAFQALKATSTDVLKWVAQQPDPNSAKRAGRTLTLRSDWERIKYDVMAAVVRAKFHPDREEGERLAATEGAYLCEGTYWGDTCWGVDLHEGQDFGRNWLGTLLQARRAELRACYNCGEKIPDGTRNMEFIRASGSGNYNLF